MKSRHPPSNHKTNHQLVSLRVLHADGGRLVRRAWGRALGHRWRPPPAAGHWRRPRTGAEKAASDDGYDDDEDADDHPDADGHDVGKYAQSDDAEDAHGVRASGDNGERS